MQNGSREQKRTKIESFLFQAGSAGWFSVVAGNLAVICNSVY
jgi:hypothetical protein